MEFKKIEIFDSLIKIPSDKINTNTIRNEFNVLSKNESSTVVSDFYDRFSNLDELYNQSIDLVQEVLQKAIGLAMKTLSSYEIYEVTEEQFFSDFCVPYITWDDDFRSIATQYEEITENTANLDAHRTARRQNRSKWVGLNQKGVYDADAKNLFSNIGHGAFNLMAKAVTETQNSIKKDEIFKSKNTVSIVGSGVSNIVNAVFLGTIKAINTFKPKYVYSYSEDEISKSEALIEAIEKGRIPNENIIFNLLKAIEFYPYNQKIYTLILYYIGGDNGNLNTISAFFGMDNLNDERENLFLNKIKDKNISTTLEFYSNLTELRSYAKKIEYLEYDSVLDDFLEILKENDFKNEVLKYSLKTPAECDDNLPKLEEFAEKIKYSNFSDWSSNLRKEIEAIYQQEEIIKQQQKQEEEEFAKKSKFMQFMTSDDPSVKKKRGTVTLVLIISLYVLWQYVENNS
mgnify:CR=1 FL=1